MRGPASRATTSASPRRRASPSSWMTTTAGWPRSAPRSTWTTSSCSTWAWPGPWRNGTCRTRLLPAPIGCGGRPCWRGCFFLRPQRMRGLWRAPEACRRPDRSGLDPDLSGRGRAAGDASAEGPVAAAVRVRRLTCLLDPAAVSLRKVKASSVAQQMVTFIPVSPFGASTPVDCG